MNENERDRIAAAMHQLRPDWPAPSIRTLLDRPSLRDRPRRDVAVALAYIACDSKTQTPARVIESGPWWVAASVEGVDDRGAVRNPFDPQAACDECSQPEHRHGPTSGHDFISAHDAARQRSRQHDKPPLPRFRPEAPDTGAHDATQQPDPSKESTT